MIETYTETICNSLQYVACEIVVWMTMKEEESDDLETLHAKAHLELAYRNPAPSNVVSICTFHP